MAGQAVSVEAPRERARHLPNVVGTFDAIAADYRVGQARQLNTDLLTALAEVEPDDVVLDVATGTGAAAIALARWARAVVGIDVTPGMLAQARAAAAEAGVRPVFAVGSAEQLPFVDGSFDLVTCSRALHHMVDPARGVAELARVVRPGGRVVVVDPLTYEDPDFARRHNELERRRDRSHARTMPMSELRAAFAAAGLELTAVAREEFVRTTTAWFDHAGTDPAERDRLLVDIAAGLERRDEFFVRHFRRGADGAIRFRYPMVCVAARKTIRKEQAQ